MRYDYRAVDVRIGLEWGNEVPGAEPMAESDSVAVMTRSHGEKWPDGDVIKPSIAKEVADALKALDDYIENPYDLIARLVLHYLNGYVERSELVDPEAVKKLRDAAVGMLDPGLELRATRPEAKA